MEVIILHPRKQESRFRKSEKWHPDFFVLARKTFFAISSETDCVKFSARSGPSSGGNGPFEISRVFEKLPQIGVRFWLSKSHFFKNLNYRDLEIRDLHANSLHTNLFSAHSDIFFVFSKSRFFLLAKNVDLGHFFSCMATSRITSTKWAAIAGHLVGVAAHLVSSLYY